MTSLRGHWSNRFFRSIAGAVFGAGLSSLAHARVPASVGPESVVLFGFPLPIMAALFAILGVLLARRVAPVSPATERLGATGNVALTILLVLGVLALVIAGEKRPLVALGYAVGFGYSGLAIVELVARSALLFARTFLSMAARVGAAPADPPPGGGATE